MDRAISAHFFAKTSKLLAVARDAPLLSSRTSRGFGQLEEARSLPSFRLSNKIRFSAGKERSTSVRKFTVWRQKGVVGTSMMQSNFAAAQRRPRTLAAFNEMSSKWSSSTQCERKRSQRMDDDYTPLRLTPSLSLSHTRFLALFCVNYQFLAENAYYAGSVAQVLGQSTCFRMQESRAAMAVGPKCENFATFKSICGVTASNVTWV